MLYINCSGPTSRLGTLSKQEREDVRGEGRRVKEREREREDESEYEREREKRREGEN
jgi:hypothetical protein